MIECPVVIVLLATMAVNSIAGCGARKMPALETFPVTGQVLIDGQPPYQAEVRLRPVKSLNDPLKRSIEPYARVDKDGYFYVSTYREKDGAPLGKYAVLIVWPEITVDGGEEVIGPDRLRGRFGNPNSPVSTFEVIDGSNLIPEIKLQTR